MLLTNEFECFIRSTPIAPWA